MTTVGRPGICERTKLHIDLSVLVPFAQRQVKHDVVQVQYETTSQMNFLMFNFFDV
jgi:hypothetical protein